MNNPAHRYSTYADTVRRNGECNATNGYNPVSIPYRDYLEFGIRLSI